VATRGDREGSERLEGEAARMISIAKRAARGRVVGAREAGGDAAGHEHAPSRVGTPRRPRHRGRGRGRGRWASRPTAPAEAWVTRTRPLAPAQSAGQDAVAQDHGLEDVPASRPAVQRNPKASTSRRGGPAVGIATRAHTGARARPAPARARHTSAAPRGGEPEHEGGRAPSRRRRTHAAGGRLVPRRRAGDLGSPFMGSTGSSQASRRLGRSSGRTFGQRELVRLCGMSDRVVKAFRDLTSGE